MSVSELYYSQNCKRIFLQINVYELVHAAMGARLVLKLASQSAAQTSLGTILGQDLEVAGVFQKEKA